MALLVTVWQFDIRRLYSVAVGDKQKNDDKSRCKKKSAVDFRNNNKSILEL